MKTLILGMLDARSDFSLRKNGSLTTRHRSNLRDRLPTMIHRIEITFDLPVELSDEEMRALEKVAGHICDRECPEGWAFWPSGFGSKPSFSQADAAFLGKPVDPNAPATGEPTWDDDVFQIDCSARPLHPGEVEKRELRKAQREKLQRSLSYRVKRACGRIKSAITEF